jgi:copper chaperone CopZ
MLRFLLFLVSTQVLSAEFLRIELVYEGKECASCGKFIEEKLKRNAGVQSVVVDAKQATVMLSLKPGNPVRPSHLRDLVQQTGYQPKHATVKVTGTVRVDRGYTHLELGDGRSPIRLRDSDLHLRAYGNKKVEIDGVDEIISTDSGPLEIIQVKKAALAP